MTGEPAGTPVTVAAVRHHRHRAQLLHPFVTAARRTEAVEYVVVEVELADGTVGQGSAAETRAVTGEDAETIERSVAAEFAPALRGATGTLTELLGRLPAPRRGATSARSAVDVAVHDAVARAAGVPLTALLAPAGATVQDELENDMTVSLEDPATMAARATEAVADGTRILKIKLGRDVEEDAARLRAVLAAAPQARLRLDANQGWSVADAIAVISGMEDEGLPVDLVEQPVAAEDVAGLARVRAAVSTPIMADEALWSSEDARRLIDAGAADLFNIKLAKTGGLEDAVRIADLAAEHGIGCMVGSMMEPRISIGAAVHLSLAHPAVTMVDLDAPLWFASTAPEGGFEQTGGTVRLTGGAGLGLQRLDARVDTA